MKKEMIKSILLNIFKIFFDLLKRIQTGAGWDFQLVSDQIYFLTWSPENWFDFFVLTGEIKWIHLHLCFDRKNPANWFQFLLWHENSNKVMWICILTRDHSYILRNHIFRIFGSPSPLRKHVFSTENNQKLALSDPPPPLQVLS